MDPEQNKTQDKKSDVKKRYKAIITKSRSLNTAFFRITPIFLILIALPLIVLLSLSQQELRQRAAVTTSCNDGLICGACSATSLNTCSFGNGTQSCQYTTSLDGSDCNPVSFPNVICHVDNCSTGSTCSNQQCVSNSPPTPNNK